MSTDVQVAVLVFAALVLLVLFAGIWFMVRHAWPYFMQQSEHRLKEQAQFLAMLGSHTKATDRVGQYIGQMIEASSLQTNAIQRLADDLRRQKRKPASAPPKDKTS